MPRTQIQTTRTMQRSLPRLRQYAQSSRCRNASGLGHVSFFSVRVVRVKLLANLTFGLVSVRTRGRRLGPRRREWGPLVCRSYCVCFPFFSIHHHLAHAIDCKLHILVSPLQLPLSNHCICLSTFFLGYNPPRRLLETAEEGSRILYDAD